MFLFKRFLNEKHSWELYRKKKNNYTNWRGTSISNHFLPELEPNKNEERVKSQGEMRLNQIFFLIEGSDIQYDLLKSS